MFTHKILPTIFKSYKPSSIIYDLLAYTIIGSIFILLSFAIKNILSTVESYQHITISLSLTELPYYSLMSVFRMLIALSISILFTLIVGTLAAKNKKAESIIIPCLDALQSIPILGYLSFTITGFLALFPGKALGLELAAIFVIFTSQVWNMTFSLYQSLKTIPPDLQDASLVMRLSPWQRFWKLEIPFAMPGLIWNTMMSMSGGWFFIVASEAVSVGERKFLLPGIGSYLSIAIEHKDLNAVGYSIAAMFIVILLYDQLIFRPMVSWADKFRCESTASEIKTHPWVTTLFQHALFFNILFSFIAKFINYSVRIFTFKFINFKPFIRSSENYQFIVQWFYNIIWYGFLTLIFVLAINEVMHFFYHQITLKETAQVFYLGLITFMRIIIMVMISLIIWVPIGVYIGLRPKIAEKVQPIIQFLAAFPANLFFPLAVILIIHYKLNSNIWLSPLMIIGTQWYILFNVIAGANSIPNDLNEASSILHIKKYIWWRKVILPGIYPYLITGMITSTGNAWNASVISEAVSWGSTNLYATGLGSYIAEKTVAGNLSHTALGIFVMCVYVITLNKLLWRPLYYKAVNLIHLN